MTPIIAKPDRFDAFLSSTPVTHTMKAQVDELAKREGVSRAYIVRAALALFLAEIVSKTNTTSEENSQMKGGDQRAES